MIFISIESFLKLGGLVESVSVGALLLEETCELASKMLSATCPTPLPFRLRRTIARMAQRVLYTDADFEADGRCITFARYLCPSLPLRIFTLKHTVELSKRSAKFFFHHPTASRAESNYARHGWRSSKPTSRSGSGPAELPATESRAPSRLGPW